jgi:arsenite-transporting ATPase
MLELPGAWSGYLEANPDAAANLGPLVGLEKQQHQYSDAVKALSDAALTRLVLVARAQASTLKEVSHTHDELLLSVCSINTLPSMVCCRRLLVK